MPSEKAGAALLGCGRATFRGGIHSLVMAGAISSCGRGQNRVLTILTGDAAGRALRAQPSLQKPFQPTPKPSAATTGPAPLCVWCGGRITSKTNKLSRNCCSISCSRDWMRHGSGPNKAQVEARTAHLAAQPKGCDSVEQFLASGGTVYREQRAGAAR